MSNSKTRRVVVDERRAALLAAMVVIASSSPVTREKIYNKLFNQSKLKAYKDDDVWWFYVDPTREQTKWTMCWFVGKFLYCKGSMMLILFSNGDFW